MYAAGWCGAARRVFVQRPLRENVRLHDQDITDDRIWEAIRGRRERFVERLPEGLDHDVRERGPRSAGQRHRLPL